MDLSANQRWMKKKKNEKRDLSVVNTCRREIIIS